MGTPADPLSTIWHGDMVSARVARASDPQQDAVVHVTADEQGVAALPEGTYAFQGVHFEHGQAVATTPWCYVGPEVATCTKLRLEGRLDPWFAERDARLHPDGGGREHLILITQGGHQRMIPPGFDVTGCPARGLVQVALDAAGELSVVRRQAPPVALPLSAWGLTAG
jgi:hypothetical protein